MNEESTLTEAIRERAIHWVLRQRDADMPTEDWAAFTEWLEADPKHLKAYDQAVEADDDLDIIGDKLAPADDLDDTIAADNDNLSDGLFSRWPAFGALAAVLLAAIVFWPGAPDPQFATLQTEVGEIREVAVNSSVSMVMNGNTKLDLDKESATIRMLRGEVTYSINNTEPGAVRVEIDDLVLVDYGTVFNVVRGKDLLKVAVTEGAVMVDPEGEKILVSTGEQIDMQLEDRSVKRSNPSPDVVLAWQDRQLVFEEQPVESVIGDIERNFATKITVSDGLLGQKITGAISLANDETTVINDVAAVLGSVVEETENGWHIAE